MTSIDDDLARTSGSVRLRGDREEELLGELLSELAATPTETADRTAPTPVVVEFPTTTQHGARDTRSSRSGWYAVVAATVAVVVAATAIWANSSDSELADDRAPSPAAAIAAACESFSADAGDGDTVAALISASRPDARALGELRVAFDQLTTDIEALPLTAVPIDTRRALGVIGGHLEQADLALSSGGPDPSATVRAALDRLAQLASADVRFGGCSALTE